MCVYHFGEIVVGDAVRAVVESAAHCQKKKVILLLLGVVGFGCGSCDSFDAKEMYFAKYIYFNTAKKNHLSPAHKL